jgi:molybdate transport system ATP-binding protein
VTGAAAVALSLDVALERRDFTLAVRQELALEGITALFGPSGAGKTTLLRIVAGLENGARGAVTFDGERWLEGTRSAPAHRRAVGYVFQDARLFAHLSVAENLRFAERRAARRAARPAGIGFDAAVGALDLSTLLHRRPVSLSGGEQQRVAIARALLTNPRLLLMDEPLSSLDLGRKREIVRHIERLPSAFGVPVLYVTHNVDEVARLASNVMLLAGGRNVAYGPVATVLERPDLWPLTGERQAGTVLETRVIGERAGIAALAFGGQSLFVPLARAQTGASLRIRIHASDVALATARPERISIRNIVAARIASIVEADLQQVDVLLEVDGQHLRSRITRDAVDDLALAPGMPVFALIKSVALETALFG